MICRCPLLLLLELSFGQKYFKNTNLAVNFRGRTAGPCALVSHSMFESHVFLEPGLLRVSHRS